MRRVPRGRLVCSETLTLLAWCGTWVKRTPAPGLGTWQNTRRPSFMHLLVLLGHLPNRLCICLPPGFARSWRIFQVRDLAGPQAWFAFPPAAQPGTLTVPSCCQGHSCRRSKGQRPLVTRKAQGSLGTGDAGTDGVTSGEDHWTSPSWEGGLGPRRRHFP